MGAAKKEDNKALEKAEKRILVTLITLHHIILYHILFTNRALDCTTHFVYYKECRNDI